MSKCLHHIICLTSTACGNCFITSQEIVWFYLKIYTDPNCQTSTTKNFSNTNIWRQPIQQQKTPRLENQVHTGLLGYFVHFVSFLSIIHGYGCLKRPVSSSKQFWTLNPYFHSALNNCSGNVHLKLNTHTFSNHP